MFRAVVGSILLVCAAVTTSAAKNIELSIQHSLSATDNWQDYAEVVITSDEISTVASSLHVLGPIPDHTAQSSFCADLWEKMTGTESVIRFKVIDKARNETAGLSYCDLTPIKNWKQFCRLVSNIEFVIELDADSSNVKSVMVKPPTPKQEQMSLKRLGFMTLLSADSAAQVSEPEAPVVLPQAEGADDPTAVKKPQPRGNWWWGILMAMVAMQVLNALAAKEELTPAPTPPTAPARATGRRQPRASG